MNKEPASASWTTRQRRTSRRERDAPRLRLDAVHEADDPVGAQVVLLDRRREAQEPYEALRELIRLGCLEPSEEEDEDRRREVLLEGRAAGERGEGQCGTRRR